MHSCKLVCQQCRPIVLTRAGVGQRRRARRGRGGTGDGQHSLVEQPKTVSWADGGRLVAKTNLRFTTWFRSRAGCHRDCRAQARLAQRQMPWVTRRPSSASQRPRGMGSTASCAANKTTAQAQSRSASDEEAETGEVRPASRGERGERGELATSHVCFRRMQDRRGNRSHCQCRSPLRPAEAFPADTW